MSLVLLDFFGSDTPTLYHILIGIVVGFFAAILIALWASQRANARFTSKMAEAEGFAKENLQQTQNEYLQALHYKELELAKSTTLLEAQSVQLSKVIDENEKYRIFKEEYIQLQTKFAEQLDRQKSEQHLLDETKGLLFKEFELVANKLFEAKHQSFEQSSRVKLESVLAPFKNQLTAFNQRIEDIYHKENSQRNQLVGQIAELQKQAKQISQEANNLASALKGDNKVQGNWGEIVLERLLEQSGLEKGREYETQQSYKDESGKRLKPDVIVHLPDNKDIVIDAKMSLIDYERYCNETEAEARNLSLKAHVESIRSHIRGLSVKNYEQLEGIRTLDFVFIFIPVEAAYILAIQASPNLFKEAYDKNIVLVSPSSLMVALRTVETIWRYEKQNANAEEIAKSAGKIYDQFALFIESLEEVGRNIDRAKSAYDTSFKRLTSGRGNVLRRVEALKQLGARATKTLPANLSEDDETLMDDELNQDAQRKEVETLDDVEKLEGDKVAEDMVLQEVRQQDA